MGEGGIKRRGGRRKGLGGIICLYLLELCVHIYWGMDPGEWNSHPGLKEVLLWGRLFFMLVEC